MSIINVEQVCNSTIQPITIHNTKSKTNQSNKTFIQLTYDPNNNRNKQFNNRVSKTRKKTPSKISKHIIYKPPINSFYPKLDQQKNLQFICLPNQSSQFIQNKQKNDDQYSLLGFGSLNIKNRINKIYQKKQMQNIKISKSVNLTNIHNSQMIKRKSKDKLLRITQTKRQQYNKQINQNKISEQVSKSIQPIHNVINLNLRNFYLTQDENPQINNKNFGRNLIINRKKAFLNYIKNSDFQNILVNYYKQDTQCNGFKIKGLKFQETINNEVKSFSFKGTNKQKMRNINQTEPSSVTLQKIQINHNLIKNSKLKKHPIQQNNYFGKICEKNQPQQNQRIRVLYYKDLIWKVFFNQGFKFKQSQKQIRYFIGNGNNSKLVKNIMGKRWWWSSQSKIQNANIIWTQLKTYSIYQTQPIKKNQPQFSQILKNQDQEWEFKRLQFKDKSSLLLTEQKYLLWKKYISHKSNIIKEKKSNQSLIQRKQLQQNIKIITIDPPKKISNHLQYSRMIGNKKALYKTMKLYQQLILYPQHLNYLPLTFHIVNGIEDQQYLKFLNQFYKKAKEKETRWIVKPGQMSNRGRGIKVCNNLQQIKNILKSKQTHSNGTLKSYIIQEYISNPLLYKGRKFDLRHYLMITSTQGMIRGYFYQEGYVRTTSYKYTLDQISSSIHLTNDAVQKHCKDYGKYQKGNKVSYEDFDKYLKNKQDGKRSFYKDIFPQIRKISIDIVKASYYLIDPNRRFNNFQIFGLDIMIDDQFKTWLIEVNTNPCLELSSPVLSQIIPKMLDNAFSIALDPLYPPPVDILTSFKKTNLPNNSIIENKFQLIFDEAISGRKLNMTYLNKEKQIQQINGYGQDQEAYESNQEIDMQS